MKAKTETKQIEVSECQECNSLHERIPQRHAGDEGWSVCPDCQTVEGNWKTYVSCECNEAPEDTCVEKLEGGKSECPNCKGLGWEEM